MIFLFFGSIQALLLDFWKTEEERRVAEGGRGWKRVERSEENGTL